MEYDYSNPRFANPFSKILYELSKVEKDILWRGQASKAKVDSFLLEKVGEAFDKINKTK